MAVTKAVGSIALAFTTSFALRRAAGCRLVIAFKIGSVGSLVVVVTAAQLETVTDSS